MLKTTDKEKLKSLGLDIDAIIAAHADTAEKDIVIPDGKIYTDAQLTTRDDVKVKEGKKEGEKEAVNIAKVEIKKHAGIEIKADRWGDIGTELKAAMNADKDTKLTALTDQNALLLKDVDTYKTKAEQAETAMNTGLFEVSILGKLPAHAAGLSPKESFELAKMRGYVPEKTDAGVVWKRNGEVMKDPATHAALAEDKAIAQIWNEQKWTPTAAPAGGRGAPQKPAGSGAGSGIMSKSQAEEAWTAINPDKNMATPEGMAWYNEQAKQVGFNMYE